MTGAIEGMLDKLDPHSSYIPAENKEEVDEVFRGDFEGIGIEFSIIDGYITITCDGGSWQSEVAWTITSSDGTTLSGGAPFTGL